MYCEVKTHLVCFNADEISSADIIGKHANPEELNAERAERRRRKRARGQKLFQEDNSIESHWSETAQVNKCDRTEARLEEWHGCE